MSRGFQIEIQKDLTEKELENAIDFAIEWIGRTCSNDLTYYLGGKTGGYKSYLRRNRFGFMINHTNTLVSNTLVFRRISTGRRIFGIIRANTMIKPNGSEFKLKQCMCPKHRGGERVIWRDNKPETFIYAKVGRIKDGKRKPH